MHNNVTVKNIENASTVNGFDDLLEHKACFLYMNTNGNVQYHSATMIHVIYKNTDPNTEVEMDSALKGLETAQMSLFFNNAGVLLKSTDDKNLKTIVVFSCMLW